jgi:hypothetical protein
MHPLIIITALLLPEDTQLETPIVKYDMNANSMCRCSPHGHMEKTAHTHTIFWITLAFEKLLGIPKLKRGTNELPVLPLTRIPSHKPYLPLTKHPGRTWTVAGVAVVGTPA